MRRTGSYGRMEFFSKEENNRAVKRGEYQTSGGDRSIPWGGSGMFGYVSRGRASR